MKGWPGVIEQYRDFLPVTAKTPVVTLHEGNTPLVPAPRLAEATDARLSVYLKCEGFNPTGSFKDRGMTMAVSKALESGSRAVICASTGNTSASAAAFAARAQIRAFVMVPRGAIALGKLSQAAIHGARVLTVEGNFDQALAIVRQIAETHPVTLVNSVNPFRLDGQKTAAFEIVDQLGRAPDYHLIPVGNAGNITAYWRGYREYHRAGLARELPRMVGFQAAGAAPIYENRVIEEPRTIATAIKIGNPANWGPAVEAVKDSRGWIDIVTDEEILGAYRMLAREEGIFMEPASAATVAGLIKSVKAGRFEPGATLVLTLTGHGLKDPDTALESASRPTTVPARLDAVLAQLGL
ncbi:MAG: threonine synthase [Candidatus Rokubacteria bacterium]|nr:threonine synthase [Candidatus Rokubacteria bacterium]